MNLKELYTSQCYPAHHVWNCDEIGVQGSRNRGAIVIGHRRACEVHRQIPDQWEWLSILICINIVRSTTPSFYIFKGQRIFQNYIRHCESGATMAMQSKAWITSDLFIEWISHFIHICKWWYFYNDQAFACLGWIQHPCHASSGSCS